MVNVIVAYKGQRNFVLESMVFMCSPIFEAQLVECGGEAEGVCDMEFIFKDSEFGPAEHKAEGMVKYLHSMFGLPEKLGLDASIETVDIM